MNDDADPLVRRLRGDARILGHCQWTAGPNTRAHELLEQAGYHQVRSYWRMGRELEPGLARPREPPGVRITPVTLNADARALHSAYEAAFAANADHTPEEFAVFRAHHLAAHDFEPALSSVARREGRIGGSCCAGAGGTRALASSTC